MHTAAAETTPLPTALTLDQLLTPPGFLTPEEYSAKKAADREAHRPRPDSVHTLRGFCADQCRVLYVPLGFEEGQYLPKPPKPLGGSSRTETPRGWMDGPEPEPQKRSRKDSPERVGHWSEVPGASLPKNGGRVLPVRPLDDPLD